MQKICYSRLTRDIPLQVPRLWNRLTHDYESGSTVVRCSTYSLNYLGTKTLMYSVEKTSRRIQANTFRFDTDSLDSLGHN